MPVVPIVPPSPPVPLVPVVPFGPPGFTGTDVAGVRGGGTGKRGLAHCAWYQLARVTPSVAMWVLRLSEANTARSSLMLDERETAVLTRSTSPTRGLSATWILRGEFDGAGCRPLLAQVRVEGAEHALLGPIGVSRLERRGQGEAEVRLAGLLCLDVLAHDVVGDGGVLGCLVVSGRLVPRLVLVASAGVAGARNDARARATTHSPSTTRRRLTIHLRALRARTRRLDSTRFQRRPFGGPYHDWRRFGRSEASAGPVPDLTDPSGRR